MEQNRSYIRCGKTIPAGGVKRGSRRLLAKLGLPGIFALMLVCGCESDQEDAMANSYYLHPHKDLRRLGRVAFVEMDSTSSYPEIATAVTDALFLEAQKRQAFGVMVVHRDDPTWRSLQENLDSLQALRQLVAVRDALNCNGLLVGTITKYEPYPHMVIGLRLKLLDLADGQLLWGLEQVWDSSDRSIQKRIKAYLKEDRRTGHAPLREELVVVSPLNYCKFVTYEVAKTFERTRKK
jgi:hypothetical protein